MCTGRESRLFDCHSPGVGIHNCGHNEDAGVRCKGRLSTLGVFQLCIVTVKNVGMMSCINLLSIFSTW